MQKKSSVHYPPTPLTLSQDNMDGQIERTGMSDVKVVYQEVPGLPDAIVDRQLTVNSQRELVAIWWRDCQEGGVKWSSLAAGGKNNITIIRIKKLDTILTHDGTISCFLSNGKFEVFFKLQTEFDPVSVFFRYVLFDESVHVLQCTFSKVHNDVLYSLNQSTSTYELCVYNCGDKHVTRKPNEAVVTNTGMSTAAITSDILPL